MNKGTVIFGLTKITDSFDSRRCLLFFPLSQILIAKSQSMRGQKVKISKNSQMGTWSWPSGRCFGLRSRLRGFDAQLGHLHDACTSLPKNHKLQLCGLK